MKTFEKLKAPFPANEVEWRIGSTNKDKSKGLALAYLTARHVMDRLDAVVGPDKWQDRYETHGAKTLCYISLKIGDEWVTKGDGAGDTQVEAEKGSISDAFKRTAVKWGIGRYLYELDNIWVACEPAGRSVKISKHEYARLQTELDNRFGEQTEQKTTDKLRPSWAEERDDLIRLLTNVTDRHSLASLCRTARMGDFMKDAPDEFKGPVNAEVQSLKKKFPSAKEAA